MKERIDDYIAGRMSESERSEFERLMNEDSELQAIVDNYSSMEKISDGLLEMKLMNEVQSAQKLPRRLKGSRRWIYVVVGLLALITAVTLSIGSFGEEATAKQKQYFADNYQKVFVPNVMRSGSDFESMSDYEKGLYSFSLNDWENSKLYLDKIINESTDIAEIDTAAYYLGHTYLNLGQYEKAKELFNQTNLEGTSIYLDFISKLQDL